MAKENREHKDSVFIDLFHTDETARANLLELYNALYDTDYSIPQSYNTLVLKMSCSRTIRMIWHFL